MNNLEVFEQYFNTENLVGEFFLDRFWIKSNKFYVFLVDGFTQDKAYVMFSKKYYLTIELTRNKKFEKGLQDFAEIVDIFRQNNDLKVEKYEFWLPHCLVNNQIVKTQFIAEAYGVSRELALDYLIQYDKTFSAIYNKEKQEYLGLPLFKNFEDAEDYPLKDNTKKYLKGLKILERFRRGN